jgi:hypothetical protein
LKIDDLGFGDRRGRRDLNSVSLWSVQRRARSVAPYQHIFGVKSLGFGALFGDADSAFREVGAALAIE